MSGKIEDWECSNAVLLLEQAWAGLAPAFEALCRISGIVVFDDREVLDTRLMVCDSCARPLYRLRDGKVIRLQKHESREGLGMTIRPVTLTLRNQMLMFCSNPCASRWIATQEPDELRGGYPLFW